MHIEDIEYMPYKVGGLIYTPATDKKIADKLKFHSIPFLTSIAFCLEDSITDNVLDEAERNLKNTLEILKSENNMPMLFVRVRTPEHFEHIINFLGHDIEILTGFILPKFDLNNIDEYFKITEKLNSLFCHTIYIMPTIETPMFASAYKGTENLEILKNKMNSMKKYILNIRVGGNDFLNIYGLRRNIRQNIYQVGVIRDILINILNIFSADYVVSGPVWEYYDNNTDDKWKTGLEKELELDRLNGFIGKTAIHPSQLPVIYESLKPFRNDYEDAKNILSWSEHLGVKSSFSGNRMNEVKTHQKFAERTLILAKIYGIKENI
ncbi:MAG: HpcH/HpaI aldolase/citrate lyase family protein [Ruminococcus sp.]|nr:HpcH/HpaI aldolase/citrate lyase family protein [Ruminococcus sp.]